ncbi:chemotaxis protein CheW [Sphingomonas sp. FW199]|uniref:chemotaxis protein CheW n=1 Tax=unclassified Sphingomonas TaxID=196159 RepID=UPI0021A37B81|nr:chemotaxis protein CheW [Sphingomonas sp. BGYR3]MDG5487550.1 chemotaxis protein CheW [Sphingomonas sp. BGYR3]
MNERLYLLAQLDGRTVAIDSDQVESVVDLGDITPVPCAPAGVCGLAALRSRVVTVIDSRVALGLAGVTESRRAIIIRYDNHHYAMLVDALDDIVPLAMTALNAALPIAGEWSRAATGVIDHSGEPVLVINLAALVPSHALAA